MIKRFIIAIILLVIVVGGIVGFNIFRDQAISNFFANMPVQPSAVTTATVEPVTWKPDIQAIGTVSANRGVDLTVEVTGIVQTINFTANQRVEKGDVLVQLDDTQQQADLAAQRATAALDAQSRDRALELRRRGVGAETNVEQSLAAAVASAAQVQKLEAVLEQKKLVAPFSGTMGIPRVEPGQYLSPGTNVATIQDLDTMRADFSIPEQRLSEVSVGQDVRFGLDSNEFPFAGKITGIEPKIDPVTRLVLIRAQIDKPDGKLSPGQFVQASVTLPEEDNVIAVPQTAVVTSLYGDYVYVVRPAGEAKPGEPATPAAGEDNPAATSSTEPAAPAAEGEAKAEEQPAAVAPAAAQPASGDQPAAAAPADGGGEAAPSLVARQIFVQTGRRSAGLVEVTDGLKPGDQIVTSGQNRLTNGGPVTIDNAVMPVPGAGNKAARR